MNEIFETSIFFGVFISLLSYGIGVLLKRKWKLAVFNPLLIAVALTILFLAILRIDYKVYNESAKYISFLLTPATICLAVPLYEQMELLKKNYKAVLCGICSGVITSFITVLLLAVLFGLDHSAYVTLLPKSITTAIGMGVSEELGGYVAITVAVIIVTGVIGNMFADVVFRIFHIQDLSPCNRNGKGDGTWRSGRCDEQFVYCCFRYIDCGRCGGVRGDFVKEKGNFLPICS